MTKLMTKLMTRLISATTNVQNLNEKHVFVSADEAKKLILQNAKFPITFKGTLDLSGEKGLNQLPDFLCGDVLNISDTGLETLPEHLQVGELIAQNLPLTHLPSTLQVRFRLRLDGCARLQELPKNLMVGSLNLQDCVSLESLPEGLDVCFLNINRCDALHTWPLLGQIRFGHLSARDCLSLRELPHWLHNIAQLDISGCRGITHLPRHLKINGWLDLAGSGITSLPNHQHPPLRWRGVRINERIAFAPETITGAEILDEKNTEIRRVMMERIGYERFLIEVNAKVIDRDTDAGGERSLVKVELPNDEPFVAVSVGCPSTGRKYVLRVPPTIQSAHAASAWLAGFDDPKKYAPAVEA